MCISARWMISGQAFLNEDDMPQLRLSPTYRRLLGLRMLQTATVRNYVKERFFYGCGAIE